MSTVIGNARRWQQIPQNLSYRWLWGTLPEYWKTNLGNLQEQQALVAAEPSLQHPPPKYRNFRNTYEISKSRYGFISNLYVMIIVKLIFAGIGTNV